MKKVKAKKWKIPNLIFFIFLLFILLLYGQYAYLSLSHKIYGIDMEKFAQNRNTVKKTILASRGKIMDTNGDTLALNVTSYTLIAYLDKNRKTGSNKPAYVVDKEGAAEKLSAILEAPKEYILERLNNNSYQVEFGNYGRNITELKKKKIEELNITGLDFIKSVNRYYPSGNFASYTVGYAKVDENGLIKGMLGVEDVYNKELTGTNGYYSYEQDKYGYKIPDTPEKRVEAIDGEDIYLTIDSSIQRFVESAIYKVDEEYKPEWTLIEVMDAKTGAILGSSSSTSFDPNNIPSDMSYDNPLVSYGYEPGSTMKIFTYMCAIDKGVYDGNATYKSGSYSLEDGAINDWNKNGWGEITYDTGFEYSSNVAIANIIKNYLSKDELLDCFQKYGFGKNTDIELLDLKGSLNFKYDIEILAAGFGQGILTTPIQHLQGLSIIANDGYMVRPHIIKKIVNNRTKKEKVTKVTKTKKVSVDTTKKMKDLMEKVISDEWATGHPYYIEGFDIIGKTGTAQIYENGHYLTGTTDYISSISMMYPKDNPKIIIYAATKKPTSNQNYALAASIQELTKNISKYYDFNESGKSNSDQEFIVGNYLNNSVYDIKDAIPLDINTIVVGDGDIVISQYPKAMSKIVTGDKLILVTNGNLTMPNLTGLSREDVLKLCRLINIDCHFNGTGFVTSQSIPENSEITGSLEVTLEEKFMTN